MTNKVALVTGSGKRRLGSHVAEALAERGYALALHYHSSQADAQRSVEQFQEKNVEAIALAADLRDEGQARSLVDRTVELFGRIDVVVNAAATWQRRAFDQTTADDLLESFRSNTLGSFVVSQQAGLAMARQPEGGSIVLIADWAIERPYVDHAAYFVSKGSLPTLTRVLAVELAARNPRIRVNCILPGPVMLPPEMSPEERAESIRGTLVRHEGRPDNIAQAVLHFIENDFVTGVCLPVDGGRTIRPDSLS